MFSVYSYMYYSKKRTELATDAQSCVVWSRLREQHENTQVNEAYRCNSSSSHVLCLVGQVFVLRHATYAVNLLQPPYEGRSRQRVACTTRVLNPHYHIESDLFANFSYLFLMRPD